MSAREADCSMDATLLLYPGALTSKQAYLQSTSLAEGMTGSARRDVALLTPDRVANRLGVALSDRSNVWLPRCADPQRHTA